jgi:beta-lactamase superfamily II metal-dependent hydrolase
VPSTLDALAGAGSVVWRTDERGTVTITFDGGEAIAAGER